MPIVHYDNPSVGVEPRPNDQKLQANWRDIASIIPPDSLPVNFRQVEELFFRSNLPFPNQLQAIYAQGVRSIITLTESRALFQAAEQEGEMPVDLDIHHYPINQRRYLTLTEIIKICHIIRTAQEKGGVMVNCIGGVTRTGAVVSAYLSIHQRHHQIDHFDECEGLRDLFRRWVDFLTLSRAHIIPSRDTHTQQMKERFESIQRLAAEQNMAIPSFLRPHFFTFNAHTLREIIALGGISEMKTATRSSSGDQLTSLPSLHPRRQMVSPIRSGDSEIPSTGELLPT